MASVRALSFVQVVVAASARQLRSPFDRRLPLSIQRAQQPLDRHSVARAARPRFVDDDDRRHQRRTQLVIHRRRSGFVLCHPRADLIANTRLAPLDMHGAICPALARHSIAHFHRPLLCLQLNFRVRSLSVSSLFAV